MTTANPDRFHVWPNALALACPDCDRVLPLEGMRPNGTMFFHCPDYGCDRWFMAESWSSTVEWVNTHINNDYSWTTQLETRLEFMTSALGIFLRAGGENDALILQGTMPDNRIRLHLLTEGDGGVLTEVGSRLSPKCIFCPARPLKKPKEEILFELGFEGLEEWDDYGSETLPPDPDQLTTIMESVFRNVYDLQEDCGIVARFKRPAMAEIFYHQWTFTRTL